MTLIRVSDIRDNDVHPDAGMSNIPWETEYGYQRSPNELDEQGDILSEILWYDSDTRDESVLDGLSPDRPTYRGNQKVSEGTFITRISVRSGDKIVQRSVRREWLIEQANALLRAAAELHSVEVQREYIHEAEGEVAGTMPGETLYSGPCIHVVYEVHPDKMLCLVVDDVVFPVKQLTDLRGFECIGKLVFEDDS